MNMQDLAEHILTGYDDDLNRLDQTLADLGGHVEAMLNDAIKSIKHMDNDLAQSVMARDVTANRLQEKIDEDAVRLFALRNPLAADLRRVISATKIANDLERIGDLAEGMAKRTLAASDLNRRIETDSVLLMGSLVKSQLKDALDSLLSNDAEMAVQVWVYDADVDDLYETCFQEILDVMTADPNMVPYGTSLLFTAKNLERIADHATNIAESVYYTVKGEPLVRHPEIWSRS